MIWVLCFGRFENNFVYLCCLDPITDRHKEDEFQIENGIQFLVYECLLGTLPCWVFQFLVWVSSGYTKHGETKLNVHLKEYQDISHKL